MIEIYKNGERLVKTPGREKTQNLEAHEIDENLWIKETYAELRQKLEMAILPAEQYISFFDPYIKVLRMRPEEYYKQIEKEDEEEPKDVYDLKQEIHSLY